MRLRPHLSIRIKIIALLLGTLSVSLASYLLVGTRLFVEDKVSYIYDFNLAQVRAASDSIENQIQSVMTSVRVLGGTIRAKAPPAQLEDLFFKHLMPLGPRAIAILRRVDDQHFKMDVKIGDKSQNLEQILSELGWTPQMFQAREIIVGASSSGELPVGGTFIDGDQKPATFLTTLKLNPASLEVGEENLELHLVDLLGKQLLIKSASGDATEGFDKQEFEHSLLAGQFSSGVRDWKSKSGKQYIVGYRKLKHGQLMVVSFVGKEAAFMAANKLVQRSLALGGSILFLALGMCVLFAKRMTFQLKQVWHATKKVAEGDFGFRIKTNGPGNDEVGNLVDSVNTMAEKIGLLMQETAHKARMEKELETAKALQSRFFPTVPFKHPNIVMSGRYVPASECAGDWWNYAKVGPYLVTVVGDVTGHGVSSALVTAAAHGAFALLVKQLSSVIEKAKTPGAALKPPIGTLIASLNTAVRSAALEGTTMTFLASFIDLETGVMTYASASHLPPLLLRGSERSPSDENVIKLFKSLSVTSLPALGRAEEMKVVSASVQLQAGDRIFFYTDGLFESPAGKKMSQRSVFKILLAAAKSGFDAAQICDLAMDSVIDAISEKKSSDLPDDVTLVVASIPESAKFRAADENPAAVDAA